MAGAQWNGAAPVEIIEAGIGQDVCTRSPAGQRRDQRFGQINHRVRHDGPGGRLASADYAERWTLLSVVAAR